MTCKHPEMRWLDCDGCKDKGITCDAQVCVDCGAAIYDVPVPHTTIKELHTAMEIGEHRERERIIKLAKNRICFDHKNGCDHADCYALSDLILVINKE